MFKKYVVSLDLKGRGKWLRLLKYLDNDCPVKERFATVQTILVPTCLSHDRLHMCQSGDGTPKSGRLERQGRCEQNLTR